MRRDKKETGDEQCQICGRKLKFDLIFQKQEINRIWLFSLRLKLLINKQ